MAENNYNLRSQTIVLPIADHWLNKGKKVLNTWADKCGMSYLRKEKK